MIDTTRLTRDEKDVLAAALQYYQSELLDEFLESDLQAVHNEAEWRTFVCSELRNTIRES